MDYTKTQFHKVGIENLYNFKCGCEFATYNFRTLQPKPIINKSYAAVCDTHALKWSESYASRYLRNKSNATR